MHLTFAVGTLTVVLIVIAKELVHPMAAVGLAAGIALFAAFKLNLLKRD